MLQAISFEEHNFVFIIVVLLDCCCNQIPAWSPTNAISETGQIFRRILQHTFAGPNLNMADIGLGIMGVCAEKQSIPPPTYINMVGSETREHRMVGNRRQRLCPIFPCTSLKLCFLASPSHGHKRSS